VVELLRAAADRIEAARALPADVVAALHEARMFRLLLPRSLGGDELHLKTLAQVMEVIGGPTAARTLHGPGCRAAPWRRRPKPGYTAFVRARRRRSAWGAKHQGKAFAVDGGYRVTGKWTFASGCANATLLGGHSYVFERDGTPRKRANGHQADRTLLFVKSKAKIHDMWHTLGLRGTASYTYEVEDLFVPEEETLDREDPTATFEPGTLYLFHETYAYAAAFSALMLGIAQGMVNDLEALAMTKTPRVGVLAQESPSFSPSLPCSGSAAYARAYLHTTLDESWTRSRQRARCRSRSAPTISSPPPT
jgi:alkylation response protein AidB-like acyl-CoA dehydrogenase